MFMFLIVRMCPTCTWSVICRSLGRTLPWLPRTETSSSQPGECGIRSDSHGLGLGDLGIHPLEDHVWMMLKLKIRKKNTWDVLIAPVNSGVNFLFLLVRDFFHSIQVLRKAQYIDFDFPYYSTKKRFSFYVAELHGPNFGFFPNLPLSSAATTQAVAQSPHSPAKWMLSIAPGRATSVTSSLQKGVRDHGDTPWWDDPSASLETVPSNSFGHVQLWGISNISELYRTQAIS